MEKEEFQKKLAELGALAAKNEKRLTNRQVRDFFDALELSEEQYELIFAYLASRQVVVEGYVPAKKQEEERQAQVPLTPEEESFLRSYQKDLDRLELLEEAELLELCRQVEETGDDLLKARLTEQLLPEVLRLLREGGVLVSDNVLQGGDVFESRFAVERRDRTIHARMREYLYEIKHNGELVTSILPLGDGVAVSVKAGTADRSV